MLHVCEAVSRVYNDTIFTFLSFYKLLLVCISMIVIDTTIHYVHSQVITRALWMHFNFVNFGTNIYLYRTQKFAIIKYSRVIEVISLLHFSC